MSYKITRIRFTPEIRRDDGDVYTAICKELKLAAPGHSEYRAIERLVSDIRVLCLGLEREGSLSEMLDDSKIVADIIEAADEEVVVDIETGTSWRTRH